MRAKHFTSRGGLALALLLALAIAALGATSLSAQVAGERKRILLLFTHESQLPAQVILERAMRSTLRTGSPVPIEFYSEYLDAVRTPLDDYEEELVVQLERKYGGKKFDLIFAINPPALKTLLRNRAALLPSTPIVFLVLDRSNLAGLDLDPNVTGVWGETNYRSNLELALALHPGTKQVVVISGVSEWDKYWMARVQKDFRAFDGRLEFSYLIGLTIPEQQEALANLPQQTIVFFVSSTQDKAGNSYGNLEVLEQISPASSAPVYGNSDAQLGLGIVGGRLMSFEAFGVGGAQVGLRVLAGEEPGAIAPHGIPGVPMFDWRALQRWGIGEDELPPASIVRFRETTFWEQYKRRIVGILALIAIQTVFIVALLVERRKRQRAKEALDQLNAELEQRVEERTAALAAKTKELETFSYSVAHDLKAPLRGIDGYSRLLLEEHLEKLDEEGRAFLHTIRASTERMNQLIDDLLAYSRLERRALTAGSIELHSFIETLVEEKRLELEDRRIRLSMNVNGGSVIADADSLAQALRNYLDNAIKFAREAPEPQIEIGAEEMERACRLWVRDNGVGFDMKYHDRIFEIFQRLHRLEDYPGTGVGLAIVRKAMERMGGRAWAESAVGQGATFYLEIPKPPRSNEYIRYVT
jgi:signal transduction histidine kinase